MERHPPLRSRHIGCSCALKRQSHSLCRGPTAPLGKGSACSAIDIRKEDAAVRSDHGIPCNAYSARSSTRCRIAPGSNRGSPAVLLAFQGVLAHRRNPAGLGASKSEGTDGGGHHVLTTVQYQTVLVLRLALLFDRQTGHREHSIHPHPLLTDRQTSPQENGSQA